MDHHIDIEEKRRSSKWKKIFKKKTTISIIGVIIIALVFVLFNGQGDKKSTAVIERGSIVQEVSVIGKVRPSQNVDLAFISGGKIAYVFSQGNQESVKKDQKLVELENDELRAGVLQAQATLQSQQAKLNELKKGARPEELAIAQTEVEQAKETLLRNYKSVNTIINDAYIKMSDAVIKQIDDLFINDDTLVPRLSFYSANASASIDASTGRYVIGRDLASWRREIDTLPGITANDTLAIDVALVNAQRYLTACVAFLNRTMDALAQANGVDATTLASYQMGINTARINVNSALSSVTTQEQTISAQKLTVRRLEEQKELKKAGYAQEQIYAQEAMVKQAEANVASAQAQLEKTIIRAPFDGIITKKDVTVGEIVPAGKVVMSINGSGVFEIDARIAEADIAKINIGNTARVTVDAYGSGVVWDAHVIALDAAETVIEGVPTYKARLAFDVIDNRIISGLTANVDILTARKEDVMFIPIRALILKSGKQMARVVIDEKKDLVEEREIIMGIRGSDGRVEVLGGVTEGDVVLLP